MNTDAKFTILSTRAPLVEVDGDGPYYLLPGGLAVADGARTTASVDLQTKPVRKFRVETAATHRTAVIVLDSPFGAFAQIRRCVEAQPPKRWWQPLAAQRWPRIAAFLQRHARSLLALWFLLTDQTTPADGRTSETRPRIRCSRVAAMSSSSRSSTRRAPMRNDEAATVISRWDAERRIADAWPYENRLCCPDASFIHCVCRVSVRCPRHGTICVGSHD